MKNIIRNIFNVMKNSSIICFVGVLIMLFLNMIVFRLRVSIGYYILLYLGCFLAMTVVVMIVNRKNIFVKKKPRKRVVKKAKSKTKQPVKKLQKRRKIS